MPTRPPHARKQRSPGALDPDISAPIDFWVGWCLSLEDTCRSLCPAGCLESLKALLKDTNDLVRIKTTEVLCVMATHNVGR